MKKLTKKSILLALFLTVCIVFNTSAQSHLCDDHCPPGPMQWTTITLCDATHPGPPPETGPTVFVMIGYRIRTCNGITSIIIDNYVVVDNRNYLTSLGFIVNPSCTIPNPMSSADLKQASTDAINQLIGQIGNPSQGNYEVYFKGACYSLVQLSFPDGAFFPGTPHDLGQIDTFYVSSGSTVTQAIPCNDVCCKVTYQWKVVTLSNGETISRWVPISYEGDGGNCENQPMPDYNSYNPKLEATIFDPNTGQYTTVTGTVVNQEPCELTCPRFVASPPPSPLTSIKIDLSKADANIQLSASPIPFSNFIQITSNKPLTKIVIYDMKGRKVMTLNKLENGEINTSELKEGVYFIQVYFDNNNVKSLKVIKQ